MWKLLAFLLAFFFASCGNGQTNNYQGSKLSIESLRPVDIHGQLSVKGSQLVDKDGVPIQLKGMSSHGLQWFGSYANKQSMKYLNDELGQTVFRAAMYTAEGGYLSNPSLKYKVFEIVDAAIELGIYVIVDWHILQDRNPLWNKDKAKSFFDEVSKKYKNIPNVIYEIANEPNGNDVKWWNAIKPYAQELIPVIRRNSPNAIIIVGTGSWSQEVNHAADNPIDADNIMYALHFYAGSHGQWLRDRARDAMTKGIALFVTEWGTMDSSGRGGINYFQSDLWVKFMADNKISWANWSLSNSYDSHAILKTWVKPDGNWSDSHLSNSGLLMKKYMR